MENALRMREVLLETQPFEAAAVELQKQQLPQQPRGFNGVNMGLAHQLGDCARQSLAPP